MSRFLGIAAIVTVLGISCPGQETEGSSDYQYALIEAVKQKNLGNISEAVKLYRLVIKEKPDCDAAHYELGGIYLMSNQVENAINSLSTAYGLDPDNTWYTMAYINALGAGERYGEMEDILKEKIREEPGEVEWEYQLATVYLSREKPKKALKVLEGIEKERGFSEKVTLLKASVYEKREEYDLALKELEKVMVLFPEAIQFRVVAAELSQKSGDSEAAARYYREILEVDSTNIFALTNLTDYYRKKEDFAESFRYLERSFDNPMIDARRKMAILGYYLSEDQFITGYSDELEKVVRTLVKVHPEEAEARLMASDFFIQTRDYPEAYWNLKAYLEKKDSGFPLYMQAVLLANAAALNEELVWVTGQAMEQYPDSLDVRFFRAVGLYEEERYDELVELFDGVSMDRFGNPEYATQSRMLLAESWYRLEDYATSDSIFERLITEQPTNYMVLNNYSYYLAERGEKLEDAKKWSRKAIDNNPDNATFLDTYAWILYKMGEYEAAERYILRALEKGGDNDPEINEHAGDIQVALKSYDIARSYYEKAVILGGDKENLNRKIEKLNP